MGIREKLNESRGLSIGVAVGFLLLAGGLIVYTQLPAKQPHLVQSYFSDDDGQTTFLDSKFNYGPFDHNGRTAYEAAVFNVDGKNVVGYLVKFPPEKKKAIDAAITDAKKNNKPIGDIDLLNSAGFGDDALIKKPLSNTPWVTPSSPAGIAITHGIKQSDSSAAERVYPVG